MHNKFIMITGATSGIGQAAAQALATQGHEILIVGRNPAKTEGVAKQIREQTGNQAVHFLLADFSDLEQIRQLAEQIKTQFPKLDVLVNNAGAYFNRRQRMSCGVEKTFFVNHLAPFLLTNLLLDNLQSQARIINVASDAHQYGQLDLNDLNFEKSYFGFAAYARSKLANILFTYELARRLAGSGVPVNALHPGGVATNIFSTDFSIFGPLIKGIVSLFTLTPTQGADNTIYLASAPEVEGVTGKYFVKRDAVASSPLSNDEDLAKRLWEVSEKLTAK
jgi:NAD(P)-dependent dehydrogenase (short-subunit alcohol dehydrogenase family)